MKLHDRTYAAFLLLEELRKFRGRNAVVVAIAKGGVPIGYQLSRLLQLPMEVLVCKKMHHPTRPGISIGAVCENEVVLSASTDELTATQLQSEIRRVEEEALVEKQAYRELLFSANVQGKTVLLADDGASTGASLEACLRLLGTHRPARTVVAVPVLPQHVKQRLHGMADEFVSLSSPPNARYINLFYDHCPRVTVHDVERLIRKTVEADILV